MSQISAYPTTGCNYTKGSLGTDWNNPSNITADNGNYADVSITSHRAFANYLIGYKDFGLASTKKILGIQLDVRGYAESSMTLAAGIYRADGCGTQEYGILGTTKNVSFSTSEATHTVGGSTDLWGNNELYYNTHLSLGTTFSGTGHAYIQYYYITVYYEDASVPDTPTNLTGTADTDNGRIHLTWTNGYDGGTYQRKTKIYRGSTSGNETYLGYAYGTTTSYYDNSPLIGNNYYKIVATNDVGDSVATSEILVVYSPPTTNNSVFFGMNF